MSTASPSSVSGSLSSSLSVPSSILTAAASPTPPPQRPDGPAPSNPAGNGGGNQNSFGPPPQLTSSASLYLYTFLATIVLLLLVSITIVARSYALRRRQQALIAEAIANGTYVPPKKPGEVGEKPKMYEIFIGDGESAQEEGGGDPAEKPPVETEKEKEPERIEDGLAVDWDSIMPVACRWLSAPETSQSPAAATTPDATPSASPVLTPRRLSRFSLSSMPGLRMSLSSRDQARSPVPPPSILEQATSQSPTADRADRHLSLLSTEKPPQTPEPPEEKVRVSVLISMPFADPSRKRKSMASALSATSTSTSASAAESDLPYVELGTTEVSAGSLRSSLEVPVPLSSSLASDSAMRDADMGGRRADPPPVAGPDMNV